MTTRPATRWLDRVASPARTAGLVAAALLLGAGGALAATGPDVVLSAATSGEESAIEPADAPTDAATGAPTDDPTDDPTDEATEEATDDATEPFTNASGSPSESAVSEPAPTQTDEAPASDDTESTDPVSCEDARTHGEYVSGVARSVPAGPGHGQAVREAAQSDCGKPKVDKTDATDDERSEPGANKGKGHDKSHGQGHGKGKGKGHRGDS